MSAREDISAFSSGGPFSGFDASDFDAYEEKKWRSNAYTLGRRRAKDKLQALAHVIQTELDADLGKLELHGSAEAPTVANGREVRAQWAFFLRDAESRAALKPLLLTTDLAAGADLFDIAIMHQHVCLAFQLDASGLSVGVNVAGKAGVDRENLARKLCEGWAREKLVKLVHGLPGAATISFGDTMNAAALELDAGALEAWAAETGGADTTFRAGVLLPRDEPVVGSEALIGTVVELTTRFLPVYEFLAWSRDNDYTQIKDVLKKSAAGQAKRIQAFAAGDRVTILSGLFAGRAGYLAEIDGKGKAKVMVGPVSVSVEAKDIKSA